MAKVKKPKKQTLANLKKEVWVECRRIIRARNEYTCYTCGAENLVGSELQTGHLIIKGFLDDSMKMDLRVLKIQCISCNKFREGMGAIFLYNLIQDEGIEYVDRIMKDVFKGLKNPLKNKAIYEHYENLLEIYRGI